MERRKAERQRVFQSPAEDKKLSCARSGKGEHHLARRSVQQGSMEEGDGDDIDVSAIKKKVSKALKKVE